MANVHRLMLHYSATVGTTVKSLGTNRGEGLSKKVTKCQLLWNY